MLPTERWELAGVLGGILWGLTFIVFVATRIARRIDRFMR